MEDLNEIIICSIFNKLKIDAIVTVSEQYSWADYKDCWTSDGDSRYFWEVLFKENNQITADFVGEFGSNFYEPNKDLIKHGFDNNLELWKVFVENYKETTST